MKRKLSTVLVLLILISAGNSIAQQKIYTISGKVTSFEESLALEGVSILVKGTKNYTGTQADGTYSIDISPENKILVFELKEYNTQEVSLSGKKVYDVTLIRTGNSAGIIKSRHYNKNKIKTDELVFGY